MKIKYDDFKKQLSEKIEDLQNWLLDIEHGYEGENLNEADFAMVKRDVCDELDNVYDYAKDCFSEWLED